MDLSGLATADDQTRKLSKIIRVLMEQCERGVDSQGGAYSLFQTAILLEDKVRDRTRSLETALRELERTNDNLVLAKEQTEAAQVRLTEAIENISEGFVHYDAEDRLVLCNSKYVEFWPGISSVARPGISFADLSRWTVEHELVATMDVTAEDWLWRRLALHRNPKDPIVVGLKTGRWLQIRERSTRDGGTVGIYTDISEIKESEERRRERELAEKSILLQATLDNIVQGVSVFDKNLELVAWNSRFVDLLEFPEWLVQTGARFNEFLQYRAERGDYGQHPDVAIAIRVEMARQGRPLQMEQKLSNGTIVELQRAPMPGGGFVATYTDITEQKEAAEQLRDAKESLERRVAERTAELTKVNAKLRQEIFERSRMEEAWRHATAEAEKANLSKTTFIAAASHDLLQPLNAARLFVSALSERTLAEKEVEYVARIEGALASVEGLLGTILEISKFDAGAVVVEKTSFRVSNLIEALEQEYTPLAEKESVTVRVIPSSAIAYTDPALLARILRNFLSNGIRYAPGGRILLGCRRLGPTLRFEVRDNGPGIPNEFINEIFQEFRQLHTTRPRPDKGHGLGLAIAQRIAKTLGHQITVRSVLKRGTMFAVEVPIGDLEHVVDRNEVRQAATENLLVGTFIAIIENEQSVSDGMRELLGAWGCEVVAGPSDENILHRLRPCRVPDVILADYHLDDGLTGIDVIDRLRRHLDAHTPAVIITADHSPEVMKLVRARNLYLLRKPIKPARLRALISHILVPDANKHTAIV